MTKYVVKLVKTGSLITQDVYPYDNSEEGRKAAERCAEKLNKGTLGWDRLGLVRASPDSPYSMSETWYCVIIEQEPERNEWGEVSP